MDETDRSPIPRRFPSLPETAADLPELPPEFWTVVDDGTATLGLDLSQAQRAAIDSQARLLVAWNEAINLTALRTPQQIARSHVLDSLLAVPALRALTRGRATTLLDIGSGGGYPGLPVATVLPATKAALVDSIGKKARFLDVAGRAAHELVSGTRFEALSERAEGLADDPDQREGWDLVIARAVGSVAEVAEIGLPLARVRGRVVMWKRDAGDGALQSEVEDARPIIQACGGGGPRILALDGASTVGLDGHCLVVVEKRRPTPERYPRPPGERRKRR
jgi:16S rRNA (guanine527-N7)-methyltransferase